MEFEETSNTVIVGEVLAEIRKQAWRDILEAWKQNPKY